MHPQLHPRACSNCFNQGLGAPASLHQPPLLQCTRCACGQQTSSEFKPSNSTAMSCCWLPCMGRHHLGTCRLSSRHCPLVDPEHVQLVTLVLTCPPPNQGSVGSAEDSCTSTRICLTTQRHHAHHATASSRIEAGHRLAPGAIAPRTGGPAAVHHRLALADRAPYCLHGTR
jgi:hypothetical protein